MADDETSLTGRVPRAIEARPAGDGRRFDRAASRLGRIGRRIGDPRAPAGLAPFVLVRSPGRGGATGGPEAGTAAPRLRPGVPEARP